jgi:hypothetical protein
MYMKLPSKVVKPFVEETKRKVEADLEKHKEEMQRMHYAEVKERVERQEQEESMSFLQKLIRSKGNDRNNNPGMLAVQDLMNDFYVKVEYELQRKLDAVNGLLSVLSIVEEVTIDESDIDFYEIKLGAPAEKDAVSI